MKIYKFCWRISLETFHDNANIIVMTTSIWQALWSSGAYGRCHISPPHTTIKHNALMRLRMILYALRLYLASGVGVSHSFHQPVRKFA